MKDHGEAGPAAPAALPFASSLCHRCGAPARLVATDKGSVFIHCPVLKGYPPQPVRSCEVFVARSEEPEPAPISSSSART